MKKIIPLIAALLILAFLLLIYYGLKHSRGVPVVRELLKGTIISAPFWNKKIDLSREAWLETWDNLKIEAKKVALVYQVTILPWGKTLIPFVKVKVFHNGQEIFFLPHVAG